MNGRQALRTTVSVPATAHSIPYTLQLSTPLWQSACVHSAAYLGDITALEIVFVLVFGLCVGSFLNVCIRRIPSPEGLSIVRPASRCPRCKTPIQAYDNIPVISYFILGGKCRACRAPISPVYPLVESLTGLLFLLCYWQFGLSLYFLKWVTFCCLIIVLVFTDIFDRILPDAINFAGLAAGLLFSPFSPELGDAAIRLIQVFVAFSPAPSRTINIAGALLGAATGYGLLWLFATAYKLVSRREGMGMGDWKMMAMVGSFMGPQFTFLTILVGTLLGSLIGSAIILTLFIAGWRRKVAERAHRRAMGTIARLRWILASRYALPFGTFLGAAAVLVVFFGRRALDWYFSLSGLQ